MNRYHRVVPREWAHEASTSAGAEQRLNRLENQRHIDVNTLVRERLTGFETSLIRWKFHHNVFCDLC